MDRELIKVNGDIHESKRVNVVFDILHVLCNGPITLLRTGKILAMDHDPSIGGKGVCLSRGWSTQLEMWWRWRETAQAWERRIR